MTGDAQKKSDGGDDGDTGFADEDEGNTKPTKLGVAAFFAAKRAAIKLKKYWKIHDEEQVAIKLQKDAEAEEEKK